MWAAYRGCRWGPGLRREASSVLELRVKAGRTLLHERPGPQEGVGSGPRVLWGPADNMGPEGWVLPGGMKGVNASWRFSQ